MTLIEGSCQTELPFGIERCWAAIADVERSPEWQRTLVSLVVVERDGSGRPLICDTVNDAKLVKVRCRVRIGYEPPRQLELALVESDDLEAMQGGWKLEALGAARTRATYSLAVDPGRIGVFARPLERAIRPFVMGHQADELAAALATGLL